jgi:hypothetical protein
MIYQVNTYLLIAFCAAFLSAVVFYIIALLFGCAYKYTDRELYSSYDFYYDKDVSYYEEKELSTTRIIVPFAFVGGCFLSLALVGPVVEYWSTYHGLSYLFLLCSVVIYRLLLFYLSVSRNGQLQKR